MIFIIIVITLLANLADLVLKLGAREAGGSLSDPLALVFIPWVWLGAVLGISAMALWIWVLGRHHLSHAYPVFVGISFLNITLLSWLYLGEEIGLARVLGIGLILAGIMVVHFAAREKSGSGKARLVQDDTPGAETGKS